jgi:thiol-disulfide isomerase/thioredoxin
VKLSRLHVSAVAVIAAGLVFLRYVILPLAVHAPPQSLSRLKTVAPRPVPDVVFVDAASRVHHLSEWKGRFVLLNLWATWCGPCARELPSLAGLSRLMPKERFAVVAVALPPGSAVEARDFLEGHDAAAMAAYFDSDRAFLRTFHAYGLPLTLLINPQGREIARALGPEQWDDPSAVGYLRNLTGD